jgi:pSer/pThr/pTyr-binding forkhead associated (FHA) protein
MPKLQIMMPDTGEITHELVDESITLGRLPDNNIQVDDASVSSHHAQFNLSGNGNYLLKDLNSTNGTRVNGAPVTDAQLRNGDRVRLGKIEAAYYSDTAQANEPLPAAVEPVATPAAESVRPTNFENASPFQRKHHKKDPVAVYIMVFAGVAIAAVIAAAVVIFLLQPPA